VGAAHEHRFACARAHAIAAFLLQALAHLDLVSRIRPGARGGFARWMRCAIGLVGGLSSGGVSRKLSMLDARIAVSSRERLWRSGLEQPAGEVRCSFRGRCCHRVGVAVKDTEAQRVRQASPTAIRYTEAVHRAPSPQALRQQVSSSRSRAREWPLSRGRPPLARDSDPLRSGRGARRRIEPSVPPDPSR
jgi:hypothetical protein